ncbi:hypothetical protein GCM10018793_15590 [Streptomyces sulfonofaciens]|uniref:Uncharacterized protein n=1 Tax=Streptomyces sulfonofaciens TaxID=68272 RepID=A0A919FXS7_9ACTN|nr:hypothetical protein GCM10018793_15590 [Streptomyces sulfonofaciens]
MIRGGAAPLHPTRVGVRAWEGKQRGEPRDSGTATPEPRQKTVTRPRNEFAAPPVASVGKQSPYNPGEM